MHLDGRVSVNRESGPWDVGGFLQQARRQHGSASPVRLLDGEVGASYRLETRLRIYTAIYSFDLRDDDPVASVTKARRGVFLLGIRGQL